MITETYPPYDDAEDGIINNPSPEFLWNIFDTCARTELGISGKEFERRWNRGDYAAGWDREENPGALVVRLVMPGCARS